MKRFISTILLYSLPFLAVGILLEVIIRSIPNDYHYKSHYLDANSDSLEVLFLGSSHALYGINPEYCKSRSYNASYISQTLDYDLEIFKKYNHHWSNLEYVVVPISYFSMCLQLETGLEPWRIKNYTLYYGMNTSSKPADYSEVLSNRFDINVKRAYGYYFKGKSNITCSDLGFGLNLKEEKQDLVETGKSAALRHTIEDETCFKENVEVLESLIKLADEEDVKVLFYTPPAYHTYIKNLDSIQLSRTITTITDIDERYSIVSYQNFLDDTTFKASDFFDADHLNRAGAKKLTEKIGELIDNQ